MMLLPGMHGGGGAGWYIRPERGAGGPIMRAHVSVGQTGTSDSGSLWCVLSQRRLTRRQRGRHELSLAGIREGI